MKLPMREREVHYPILLFISTICLSITRGVQNSLAISVGRNGIWLFAPCVALVLFGTWLGMRIVRRSQAGSLMSAGAALGSRWWPPVSYLLYSLLFAGGSAYMLLLSGDFFSRTLLYGDSKLLITLGAILICLAATFNIESIARNAHLMTLFILPLFLFVSLLPLKTAQWSYLYPVVDPPDWHDPVAGTAAIMTMFIPLGASTLLMTRMKDKRSFRSLTVLMLAVALFASYMYAMGIATQGLAVTKRIAFMAHGTYGTIRIENFVFERIMFLAMLMWEYMCVLTSAFMVRCAVFCFAQMLSVRLKHYHLMIFAAILIVLLRQAARPQFFLAFTIWVGCYSMLMLAAYPLLLYGWMLARGRKP
ncbi:GerAB/ArcD/ProY family transporter [Cohnella zeiphila]|uniref:GerAB/ArcD/ProY family transporter n=1 Tax=Cohnella zeiphila TaxID=2761120 RepID=A0A7X0VXC1_9BACL|nr:GerAB/ArcD/ProY family transporter [Cohnella zeiphila]MBB6733282.1 GerAB/ArcD/ProY family transporter [Cohnella zeiphila]